jgi:kinetochore protein NNF1
MYIDTSNAQIPSRSPSPVSKPPIPATPGPRASTLQKLYSDAISHVLKTCNYNNFSACFPTATQNVPGTMKYLHEQFTDKLGESMRVNFEGILEDRHVVSSLNELDGLIEDARRRKGKARDGESAPSP